MVVVVIVVLEVVLVLELTSISRELDINIFRQVLAKTDGKFQK